MNKNLEQINKQSLNQLIEFLNSGFEILMESDLVALLFHCYLLTEKELLNKIHIKTRILNIEGKRIDFAIGKVTNENKRPSVNPELVIECKIFSNGFTNSQLRKRFKYLKEDIEKVGLLKLNVPKFILIFDYHDYLNINRKKEIIELRNTTDEKIKIIRILRENNQYKKQEF
ncbi:hypothetical protein BST97_01370 [Nonlabens spongiae]|uniref:Uncharacterized protein n=1 Tax=Nonlabens spongiae TaxID=331648 RepID=A0A1W6MGP3_9FLAO|nr:hypothetical protein [Nonlabens spongiae]ARN76757.1 hypothetical protein BST97_01370 [Nonlabens spongiae]